MLVVICSLLPIQFALRSQNIPFAGQGIAAALRSIEAVVDSIAYGLIDSCQAQAGNLTDQFNSLDVSVCPHPNYSLVDRNAVPVYGVAIRM